MTTLHLLFATASVALLLLLLGVWRLGRAVVPQGWPAAAAAWRPRLSLSQPAAAVIIPMTGDSPAMRAALASLLTQDHPRHVVFLTTQDEADPATALAREFVRNHPHVRHVLAGEAERGGQKTWNQLAALAAAERAMPEAGHYVFCDAGHVAAPAFLRALLEPLTMGEARVVTGYHLLSPGDSGTAALVQTLVALALHCLQGVPLLRQPWGGAMALTRQAFDDLEVAALWRDNVVDDVSLAGRLRQRGERLALAPAACLETRLPGQSWAGVASWLTRQLAYPRFIFPADWLGIGALLLLLWGLTAGALAGVLAGVLAWPWLPDSLSLAGWWGLAFLAGLGGVLLCLRGLLPDAPCRPPRGRWLLAGLLTPWLALRCFIASASPWIAWRHARYRVGRGGRVLEKRVA